jgi:hypothetical protein
VGGLRFTLPVVVRHCEDASRIRCNPGIFARLRSRVTAKGDWQYTPHVTSTAFRLLGLGQDDGWDDRPDA